MPYYNYESQHNNTPGHIGSSSDDKYKNIINVSQLPNRYIKLPNSNEFITKYNNSFCLPFSFFWINSGFLSIFIWALLNNISQDKSLGWIIFGIILLGSLACFGLYGFLFSIVKQKVILASDYI